MSGVMNTDFPQFSLFQRLLECLPPVVHVDKAAVTVGKHMFRCIPKPKGQTFFLAFDPM